MHKIKTKVRVTLAVLICMNRNKQLWPMSQTIRKPPLAEAKTALGKQKLRSVECKYLSHFCRNSIRNCFPMQNSLKSGSQLMSYGQKKRFSIWRPSAVLFFKNHIWSRDCHRVPNVLLRIEFHENRMIFFREM